MGGSFDASYYLLPQSALTKFITGRNYHDIDRYAFFLFSSSSSNLLECWISRHHHHGLLWCHACIANSFLLNYPPHLCFHASSGYCILIFEYWISRHHHLELLWLYACVNNSYLPNYPHHLCFHASSSHCILSSYPSTMNTLSSITCTLRSHLSNYLLKILLWL